MRVFGTIVGSQSLLVVTGEAKIAKARPVRPEPVGHYRSGRKTLPLQQFSQQSQRGGFVATALNQHVQNLAFAVDRPPQEHVSATNPDNHFVKVPSVIRRRTPAHQTGGNLGAEFHRPAADALITDIDATLRQQFLDIPITKREAMVQPNGMADMRPLVFLMAGAWLCWSFAAFAQDKGAVEQQGQASYYSNRLQGKKTASGAPMDQGAMTAASRKLPLGAKAKVTNLETGKTADVKINDRGPVAKGRVIDVSKKAANQLGIKKDEGVAPVKVEAKPAEQPTPELKQKVEQAAKH
jgi:hypothetical protein